MKGKQKKDLSFFLILNEAQFWRTFKLRGSIVRGSKERGSIVRGPAALNLQQNSSSLTEHLSQAYQRTVSSFVSSFGNLFSGAERGGPTEALYMKYNSAAEPSGSVAAGTASRGSRRAMTSSRSHDIFDGDTM